MGKQFLFLLSVFVIYVCLFCLHVDVYMSTYISVQLGCVWYTRIVWDPVRLCYNEELQVAVNYYVHVRN